MTSGGISHVVVVGLGYVGLPSALVMASKGLWVTGFDVNEALVNSLNAGTAREGEEGQSAMLREALDAGLFRAATTPQPADAYVVCVPTPFTEHKTADLSFVESAVRAIAPYINRGNLVVLESTVPPGTTENLVVPILEELTGYRVGTDIAVAHCPERVLPGQAMKELVNNQRIIGANDDWSKELATSLYAVFTQGHLSTTDLRTAEFVKLAENTYRDVNIAYANELANICKALDLNVWEVIRLANEHPRVSILQPGPGVGGHCIAVDPWFIIQEARGEARLIREARRVNDERPMRTVQTIMAAIGDRPSPTVACLGVSYKPNVGDVRESPALEVVMLLQEEGVRVNVCDPTVAELPGIKLMPLQDAVQDADCVVLLVNHTAFTTEQALDLLTGLPKRPVLVDTRGVWDAAPRAARLLS